MAPLTPFWAQPSHSDIQEVKIPSNPDEFTTKSLSKVDLPPFGFFAKFNFPPCTPALKPTYATVQMGKNEHLNLNSDLVYINHGCEPSLIFDMSSMSITASERGLKKGDELTFFYPSTEWNMAQGFDCFCGAATCRGFIDGAGNMPAAKLEGLWLNKHIRELLEEKKSRGDSGASSAAAAAASNVSNRAEKKAVSGNGTVGLNGHGKATVEELLKASLLQAHSMVDAAQKALETYASTQVEVPTVSGNGGFRHGVTSREMSGEMGGDTMAV